MALEWLVHVLTAVQSIHVPTTGYWTGAERYLGCKNLGKWCVRGTMEELTTRKRAATKALLEFCVTTGTVVASSMDCAKGRRRGHAATWRLPGRGADGTVNMVGLDHTHYHQPAAGQRDSEDLERVEALATTMVEGPPRPLHAGCTPSADSQAATAIRYNATGCCKYTKTRGDTSRRSKRRCTKAWVNINTSSTH